MSTLIVYPDGPNELGVSFVCANGLVSRIVSAVAAQNIPDAELVCKVMNDHVAAMSLIAALDERSMWSNPGTFETAAEEIDCGHSCDFLTHEYDTNFSMCRKSERGEYCPNDVAETLRSVGKIAAKANPTPNPKE